MEGDLIEPGICDVDVGRLWCRTLPEAQTAIYWQWQPFEGR